MTPLVLLPGLMCDARLWAPQEAAISDRDVIHGDITRADTIEAIATQVLADAPVSFALAGLSMGGIVAMEIVRQAPQRVERLALLDTNALAERPEVASLRTPQIAAARAGNLQGVLRDELKPNYLVESPKKASIMDLCMSMGLDLGPEVFERQSRALATRRDQQDTLRGYDAPALVLMGRYDKLCPRDRHELMHDLLPNSRFVIVDNAGHLPTVEQPDATTTAMLDWLLA
ncbi:MAG: alpha/beta fold hydrolase [Pseudomonadota bacterium]